MGKVYLTKSNVLNGKDTFVYVSFNEYSRIYKEYGKFFPTVKPLYMVCRVPKTEFVKEEL